MIGIACVPAAGVMNDECVRIHNFNAAAHNKRKNKAKNGSSGGFSRRFLKSWAKMHITAMEYRKSKQAQYN